MLSLRYYLYFISLTFILSSCSNKPKQEKIHKDLLQAREYIQLNKLNEAETILLQCEKQDNKNPEVYFLLGNVYMNNSDFDKALNMYDKALLININYKEVYINRGKIWFYKGERDKMCSDYKKAEQLGANNLYEYTKFCN